MESERNPLRQVHSGHRGRREIIGAQYDQIALLRRGVIDKRHEIAAAASVLVRGCEHRFRGHTSRTELVRGPSAGASLSEIATRAAEGLAALRALEEAIT